MSASASVIGWPVATKGSFRALLAPALVHLQGLERVEHAMGNGADPIRAAIFDMDGTIIDSTPAVVKHWHT